MQYLIFSINVYNIRMELLQEVKENNNMKKEGIFTTKIIIVFVIGVLFGFLGTFIFIKDSTEKSDDTDIKKEKTKEVVGSEDTKSLNNNTIVVNDQNAGIVVDVETVILENDSWVVIHEDNDGVLGNALGAQLFLQGDSSGKVELLRGMESGKIYYAVIRQDDGDRAFDLEEDTLVSDKEGNTIQVRFNTL